MPRFTCAHNTTVLQKFVLPSGRVLAFDYRGVLDTDEEGAAVIRAHPLYGRLIREGDESLPTRGELETPPAVGREYPVRRLAGPRPDPRGIAVVKVPCVICNRPLLILFEKGPSFSLKRDPPPRGVSPYDSSDLRRLLAAL